MVKSFPLTAAQLTNLWLLFANGPCLSCYLAGELIMTCGLLLFGFWFCFVFVLLKTKVRQTTPLFTQHLL